VSRISEGTTALTSTAKPGHGHDRPSKSQAGGTANLPEQTKEGEVGKGGLFDMQAEELVASTGRSRTEQTVIDAMIKALVSHV
jgi:hypothetical protein